MRLVIIAGPSTCFQTSSHRCSSIATMLRTCLPPSNVVQMVHSVSPMAKRCEQFHADLLSIQRPQWLLIRAISVRHGTDPFEEVR